MCRSSWVSVPGSALHRVLGVGGCAGAPAGLLVHGALLLGGPPAVSARLPGRRPHLLAHRLRHPAGDHRHAAVHIRLLAGGQTARLCPHPPAVGQPQRPLQRQLHGLQRHHPEEQPGP